MSDVLRDIVNSALDQISTCHSELIDLGKIVIPSLITLGATWLAYRFATVRLRFQKGIEFAERQVVEFYSPMVGCIKKIRALSALRVELSGAADTAWRKISEAYRARNQPFLDADERFKPFDAIIKYDNTQLFVEILPLYDQMIEIFTRNYWLAAEATKVYYPELVRFMEIWHRSKANALPREVLMEVGHEEKRLYPLYADLEQHLVDLTAKLAGGKKPSNSDEAAGGRHGP